MKVMTSPSASAISFNMAFRRSSNSPRYLAPATIEPMSRLMTRLPLSPSGTSPSTMRWASPSTMAVLPTPGSPIRTGLFLVRRDRTWMTRRTSSSRPMTGSIFPWRARVVRSRPYFSRAWKVSSGFCEVTRWLPRTSRSACSSASRLTPRRSDMASSRCSTDRYSSPMSIRWRSAASRASRRLRSSVGSAPPKAWGRRASSSAMRLRTTVGSTPTRVRMGPAIPSAWSRTAASTCSGLTSAWLACRAPSMAAASASWVLSVQRSGLRVIVLLRCRVVVCVWCGWGQGAATAAPGLGGTGDG